MLRDNSLPIPSEIKCNRDSKKIFRLFLGWVVEFKANCPLVEPGPIGGLSKPSILGFT